VNVLIQAHGAERAIRVVDPEPDCVVPHGRPAHAAL
jgi:hypothetical protein